MGKNRNCAIYGGYYLFTNIGWIKFLYFVNRGIVLPDADDLIHGVLVLLQQIGLIENPAEFRIVSVFYVSAGSIHRLNSADDSIKLKKKMQHFNSKYLNNKSDLQFN